MNLDVTRRHIERIDKKEHFVKYLANTKLLGTYMAEIEHILFEVLNVKVKHDFKRSKRKPISKRKEKLGFIVIQAEIIISEFLSLYNRDSVVFRKVAVLSEVNAVFEIHRRRTTVVRVTRTFRTRRHDTRLELILFSVGTIWVICEPDRVVIIGTIRLEMRQNSLVVADHHELRL
jgi:hypothetical protein